MTVPTPSKPYLSAEQVRAIVDAATSEARAQGWAVTIALVDDGGHLQSLHRMDGAAPATAYIAAGKARTAAMGRRDSKFYEDMVHSRPAFLSAPGLECLLEGGISIVHAGHCVGGIGVSGVKSHEDVKVAQAGLQALPAG